VIACCFMFLVTALFLDVWKLLIASKHKEYAEGIGIVPILAMGSVFLGIYYNLSVWFKLTNRNMFGAYITIAGAVITILLNIWWIPQFRYFGSAWATFVCYAFMMVISYTQGQKFYPVPYAWKKLIAYLVIVALLYALHQGLIYLTPQQSWLHILVAILFIASFGLFVLKVERNEFVRLPYIGKYIQQYG